MEVLYLYIVFSYIAMIGAYLDFMDNKDCSIMTIIILLILYAISPITFAILCGARLAK